MLLVRNLVILISDDYLIKIEFNWKINKIYIINEDIKESKHFEIKQEKILTGLQMKLKNSELSTASSLYLMESKWSKKLLTLCTNIMKLFQNELCLKTEYRICRFSFHQNVMRLLWGTSLKLNRQCFQSCLDLLKKSWRTPKINWTMLWIKWLMKRNLKQCSE